MPIVLKLTILFITICAQLSFTSKPADAEDLHLYQANSSKFETLEIDYYYQKKTWKNYIEKINALVIDVNADLNHVFRSRIKIPLDLSLIHI